MKWLYSVIAILIITIIVLESLDIYLSNSLSTQSLSASKYRREIEELEDQNVVLRAELLKLTSFEVIASHAASFGFVEPKHTISLKLQPQFAVSR